MKVKGKKIRGCAPRGLFALGAVFLVELVHHSDVDGDENHEDIDAALLGEPEAEFKPANANLVELLNEEDAASVGDDEPDAHEDANAFEVGAPISTGVRLLSFFGHNVKGRGFLSFVRIASEPVT